MITFTQWLEQRCIDCQELTPELEAALQSQFDAELERQRPAPLLVVPSDCQWPARGHWQPASTQKKTTARDHTRRRLRSSYPKHGVSTCYRTRTTKSS